MSDDPQANGPPPDSNRRRRPRYPGTHPRRLEHKYKEQNPRAYPEIIGEVRARGGTPAGTHLPVLLAEVMETLAPAEGECVADGTFGYGGHAEEFLKRIGPTGWLYGFDVDDIQLERTRQRLAASFDNFSIHRRNFAGIGKVLADRGIDGFNIILADLGVSSMQVDDPARGFSYKYDGPLDMRMDERLPRTAADLLRIMSAGDLAATLWNLADEHDHERIARAIEQQRGRRPIRRTSELVDLIFRIKGITPRAWRERAKEDQHSLHPAAKTFQALRILVNDELGSLRQLLRIAPACLRPNGRIGIITFHSGEERLVEQAFRDGLERGDYATISETPIRATPRERFDNPRSSSARFRMARRGQECQEPIP